MCNNLVLEKVCKRFYSGHRVLLFELRRVFMDVNAMVQGVNGFFGSLLSNISSIRADNIAVGMGNVYQYAKDNLAARPHEQQIGIGLSVIFTGVILFSTVWLLKKYASKAQPTQSLSIAPMNFPAPIDLSALKTSRKPTSSPKLHTAVNPASTITASSGHTRGVSEFTSNWEKQIYELLSDSEEDSPSQAESPATSSASEGPKSKEHGLATNQRESGSSLSEEVPVTPSHTDLNDKVPSPLLTQVTVEASSKPQEKLSEEFKGKKKIEAQPAETGPLLAKVGSPKLVRVETDVTGRMPATRPDAAASSGSTLQGKPTVETKDKIEDQKKNSAATSSESGKSKKSGKGLFSGLFKGSKK